MRKLSTVLAGIAVAASLLVSASAEAKRDDAPYPKGEARLAKMLDGRVAGQPQSCIFAPGSNELTVIDKTALVYKSGNTLYVNRPANPRDLSSNEVLVIDRQAHQLCNTDMVQTMSQGTPHFFTGSVFLGQFVPYRKAHPAG